MEETKRPCPRIPQWRPGEKLTPELSSLCRSGQAWLLTLLHAAVVLGVLATAYFVFLYFEYWHADYSYEVSVWILLGPPVGYIIWGTVYVHREESTNWLLAGTLALYVAMGAAALALWLHWNSLLHGVHMIIAPLFCALCIGAVLLACFAVPVRFYAKAKAGLDGHKPQKARYYLPKACLLVGAFMLALALGTGVGRVLYQPFWNYTVYFESREIEAAVRKELGRPFGRLKHSDLDAITSLYIDHTSLGLAQGLTADVLAEDYEDSAAGMLAMTKAIGGTGLSQHNWYDLSYKITNLRDLRHFGNLNILSIGAHGDCLHQIGHHPALQMLGLETSTQTTRSATFFSDMPELAYLHIKDIWLRDANSLENAAKLRVVTIERTRLRETPVTVFCNKPELVVAQGLMADEITELDRAVGIQGSCAQTLQELVGLPKLEMLSLHAPDTILGDKSLEFGGLEGVANLPALHTLTLFNRMEADDEEAVFSLPEIQAAKTFTDSGYHHTMYNYAKGSITRGRYLASFTRLEKLEIEKNDGSFDCTLLQDMQNLQQLELPGYLANPEVLATLPRLQELCIGTAGSMDFLAGCTGLRHLGLVSISSSHLPGLNGLGGLESLEIISAEMEDIGFLEGCESLRELYITGYAGDIAPIATCTGLQTLRFYKTENIEFGAEFTALSQLETLELSHCTVLDFSGLLIAPRLTLIDVYEGSMDFTPFGEVPRSTELMVDLRGDNWDADTFPVTGNCTVVPGGQYSRGFKVYYNSTQKAEE